MRKSLFITSTVLTAIILIGVGSYWYKTHQTNSNDQKASVNYDAPTKEEQAASKNSKDQPAAPPSKTDSPANSSAAKQAVEVTISTYNTHDSGNLSVQGYVSNVIESDGTCTLTLTDKTGKKITKPRPAEADATTTTCGRSLVPLSSLHSGAWQAVLSYSSSKSAGTSNPLTIEVE